MGVDSAVGTEQNKSVGADALSRVSDSDLAVLLRQAQWALDDAAHDFPAGRVTAQRREELAGSLEALATIVRVARQWSAS